MAGPGFLTPETRAFRRLRGPTCDVPGSTVVLGVGLIVVTDALMPKSGRPIWLVGSMDELAHLATGVVVLGALGPAVDGRLARGLMGASVGLDLDHVPQYAGADWLTAGTVRPYPHSLLTPIAAAGVFLALRQRAARGDATITALGALIGLSAHLLRDLAAPGTGVPLLWPINSRAFSVSRNLYLVLLGAGLARCLTVRMPRPRRCRPGWLKRMLPRTRLPRVDASRGLTPRH
jgi:membrane-bound metal-dependent hydrolase YbcI (DUF457 family)